MDDGGIEHIMLHTGHSYRSFRSDVHDDLVDVCRELLDRVISAKDKNRRVPIPAIECEISASVIEGAILIALYHKEILLLTLGIATDSEHGPFLWQFLTDVNVQIPLHRGVDHCPPEPWCAVRRERGFVHALSSHDLVKALDLMTALYNYERCLAWAFVERSEA